MHKALLTDSPIKLLRVWLSRCQSSLSSLPLTYKNMYVCVCVYCFHAQIMLFTSTRVHTSVSVFVYVASLLQTDGNLRHNAGGLSFEAPLPPAHFPPPLVLSLLPPTPITFPPHISLLTKQKRKLQSYTGRPQNLTAGSGILCSCYEDTNLALYLTQ